MIARIGPGRTGRPAAVLLAVVVGVAVVEVALMSSSAPGVSCGRESRSFQRWASQDVRYHRSGRKRLRHPVVGQLDLDFEAMELPSEPGLQLNIYTAPAGSPTSDALKLLASWAASQDHLATERAPVAR